MSIDDMIGRDPRLVRLAKGLGVSKAEAAGYLVLYVWPLCYDRLTAVLDPIDIDLVTEIEGFAKALIDSGLGAETKRGVRISGASERIEYLLERREAGKRGGIAKARKTKITEGNPPSSATAQLDGQPSSAVAQLYHSSVPDSASVPDPVPDLLREDSDPPAAVGTDSVPRSRKPKKPKPGDPTTDETAIAMRVLGRLGERNGVAYSGAKEHVRLIANRVREGRTELELRAVVAWAAVEWFTKPDQQKYLRPETLFGPETITRYIDSALTWARREFPDQFAEPTALAQGAR